MKNLRTALLCAGISIFSLAASAQDQNRAILNEPDENKPSLFTALPDNIEVTSTKLNEVLNLKMGTTVNITIGNAMQFQGVIVSTANTLEGKNSSVTSVVIRSTNYPGARLTITQTMIDGVIGYNGRIMSLQHGDMYELQSKNGHLSFTKKKLYDLINE